MTKDGMSIFVTGGVGFIGRPFLGRMEGSSIGSLLLPTSAAFICAFNLLLFSSLASTAAQPELRHNVHNAGSHTVLSILDHGYHVVIIDNLDNAFEEAYKRMQKLAGDKAKNMKFIKVGLACRQF